MTAYDKGKLLAITLVGLLNLAVALCLAHKFGWEVGLAAWWLFSWLYALWLEREA